MTALASFYPRDGMMALIVIALLGITLVSAAALLMIRPLKHHPAVRHAVLLSALVCILLIPALTFALDRAGLAIASIPWPTQEPIATVDTRTSDDSTDAGAAPLPVPETRGGSSESGSLPVRATREAVHEPAGVTTERTVRRSPPDSAMPSTILRTAATLTCVIWIAGTVLLSIGILRSWWGLYGIRRGLQTIGEESYHETLQQVRRYFQIDELPEIGISSGVSTPIVAGLLRPVVVLPAEQVDVIGREQLRDVLVHEVAHVIRRDNWIVLAQAVAKAILWPHLLVHRLSRCLTQAREEVCDNHVLVHTDAVEYGETLLRLAELARNHKLVPASVGILHWHGKLEQRISNLLDERRNKMTRTNALVVVAVITAFALTSAAICGTTIASANGKGASDADAKEAAGKEAGAEKKPWGDLVVRFVYDGDAPVPAKIKVIKDQGVYGDTLADQSLQVGKEGGLANVVVYFLNGEMPIHPEAKKAAERPVLLKALGGHFQPRLLPLQVGQQLTMQNQDPVSVNFHLHPLRNRASNHLARPDTEHSYRFQQAEKLPIPITCDIHPWMRAYLLPLEHSYAAVSDKDGKVRIRNLPSGDWTFRIWHEKAGYLISPEAKNRRYRLQVRPGVNDLGVVKVSPTLALGPIKGLKNKAEAKKAKANDGRRTLRLKPIRGSVVDSSGKSIVGARVYLRRRPMGVSSSSMEPNETPNLAATKTDAQGRFVFQDVQSPLGAWDEAPFPLDVIAIERGKALSWQRMSGYAPVRLTLRPEAVLHGRVVDDLGKPVQDATVRVARIVSLEKLVLIDLSDYRYPSPTHPEFLDLVWSQARIEAKTDRKGQFRIGGLPQETGVVLEVNDRRYVRRLSYAATTDVAQPKIKAGPRPDFEEVPIQNSPIAISIKRGIRVRVRVVDDATGKPIAGAPMPERWGIHPARAKTAKDGTYTYHQLKPGRFSLSVYAPPGSDYVGVTHYFQLAGDMYEIDRTVRLKHGVVVTGTVVAKGTAKPVADAPIWYVAQQAKIKDGVYTIAPKVRTDQRGQFRVTVPPRPGQLIVYGSVPGYVTPQRSGRSIQDAPARFKLDISPGGDQPPKDVRFELEPATVVRGIALNSDGKPAANVNIRVNLRRPGSRYGVLRYRTDENGKFELNRLFTHAMEETPPEAEAVFEAQGQPLAAIVKISEPETGPIAVKLNVRLQAMAEASGVVIEESTGKPIAGAVVYLTRWTADDWTDEVGAGVRTDAQGRYRLPGLLPGGVYHVRVYGKNGLSGGVKRFTATPGGEHKLPTVRLVPQVR